MSKEYRTSARTDRKREAERILAHYLSQVARGEFNGFRQNKTLTLFEALMHFEEDCKDRKLAGYDRIHSHLNAVRLYFRDIPADQITEVHIDRYKRHRLKAGRKHATINREIQYLGQALRLAVRKKYLVSAPEIEKYTEQNARQGFFEVEEFERVVSFLPHDLQDFVRFAYFSGWRKGEIAGLEWRDVEDEVIRLRPEISKTRDGRILVLIGEIGEIIERRKAVKRDDVPWVFYREQKGRYWPVMLFDKVWHKACAQAGIPGRIFHDFRRSAVRNLTRAGVPEKIAMSMTGHRTRAIYDRYNITNEADIRAGQERTQEYLKNRKSGQCADNPNQGATEDSLTP